MSSKYRKRAAGFSEIEFVPKKKFSSFGHQWIINDETYIQKIKKPMKSHKFQSPMFRVYEMSWRLILCVLPNYNEEKSDDRINSVNLQLQMLKLPCWVTKVQIQYKLSILEINAEYEGIATLSKTHCICKTPDHFCKPNSFKNIDKTLTLFSMISVKKLHGLDYQEMKKDNKYILAKSPNSLFGYKERDVSISSNGTLDIQEDHDLDKYQQKKRDTVSEAMRYDKIALGIIATKKNENSVNNMNGDMDMDMKIQIMNDALQVHSAQFLSMSQLIQDMQHKIYELNDTLQILNDKINDEQGISMTSELKTDNEEEVAYAKFLQLISPMHNPTKSITDNIGILKQLN